MESTPTNDQTITMDPEPISGVVLVKECGGECLAGGNDGVGRHETLGDHVSTTLEHRLAQTLCPLMLEHQDRHGCARRDEVGDFVNLRLTDAEFTGFRQRHAEFGSGIDAVLSGHAKSEQRTGQSGELIQFLLVEVRIANFAQVALLVLRHPYRIDEANDAGGSQAAQLSTTPTGISALSNDNATS